MGFALAREHCEAVANAEAGAVERVLKLVRHKMARFQEQGSRPLPRQGGSGGAAAEAADQAAAAPDAKAPAAAAAAADSIAALRLAGEVPSKLLAAGALGHPAAAAAFPTLDQALHASLADKEQQLEELRETNQVGGARMGGGASASACVPVWMVRGWSGGGWWMGRGWCRLPCCCHAAPARCWLCGLPCYPCRPPSPPIWPPRAIPPHPLHHTVPTHTNNTLIYPPRPPRPADP